MFLDPLPLLLGLLSFLLGYLVLLFGLLLGLLHFLLRQLLLLLSLIIGAIGSEPTDAEPGMRDGDEGQCCDRRGPGEKRVQHS